MQKNVAVVLAGCGHKDGTEITEAISALIALSEMGTRYQIFALDQEFNVKNPVSGAPTAERRNLQLESARISRGQVSTLDRLQVAEFDALILPGGFGAALHLCNWAEKGASCTVHPMVEQVLHQFYKTEKPIGGICIAPALIARVLGTHKITVTLGHDQNVAAEVRKTGALHENCAVDDYITDREHRIVTTPAYMYDDATPAQVFKGVRKAIRELIEMA